MGGCSASTSSDPLVENPHDAIRVWIHEDTMAVDEGGAHSAGSGRDGHVPRHDLAGRNRARKAGGGACPRTRPGLRPKGRAGQGRRRFQIWSDFSTDRSVVLRIAGSRDRQQNANDREMQRAHRRTPRRKEEVTDRQPRRPPFVPAALLRTAAGALRYAQRAASTPGSGLSDAGRAGVRKFEFRAVQHYGRQAQSSRSPTLADDRPSREPACQPISHKGRCLIALASAEEKNGREGR